MQGYDDLISNASSRRSRASAIGADVANSSKQLVFPEPGATKVLTRYFPLFPIMMTFKHTCPHVLSLMVMVIFSLQQLAFVINPHFSDAWGRLLGVAIAKIVYAFQFPFADPALTGRATTVTFLVFVCLLLGATIVLFGCVLFHLRRTEDKAEGKGWTSFIAAFLLEVFSTILLIPIFQFCFSCMVCGSTGHMWMLPGLEAAKCWGPAHIGCFILSILCVLLLLPVLYIKLGCVYDYRPLSDNFLACRHSTLHTINFIHDFFASFLFNVMVAWGAGGGFATILAVTSALVAVSTVYYLPFYNMNVNRFYVCVRAAQCVASLFLACSLTEYLFMQSHAAAPLFLGFGAFVVVFAVVITDFRVNPRYIFAVKKTAQCSVSLEGEDHRGSDEDVTGKSHENEDEAFAVSDAKVDALPYPGGLIQNNNFSQYVGFNKQILESITRLELHTMVGGGGAASQRKLIPVLDAYVENLYGPRDVVLSIGFLDFYARQFGVDQVHEIMLLFAANIFSKALTSFPDEPDVIQGFASYIIHYLPGLSFMGVDLLKRMLRMPIRIDQQFRAVKQAHELRIALGIRTHVHSTLGTKARTSHAKVLQSINKFWVKLTEPSVNIEEVSKVADDIKSKREFAINQFDIALRHQQHADPLLLRRLGDFFAEVLMAPDAAQECYNESRDIYEARQARSMRGTKQQTAEVDVVSLTERLRHLLHYNSRSHNVSSVRGASLIGTFAAILSVLSVCLIVFSGLLLYYSNIISTGLHTLLNGAVSLAEVRICGSRFGCQLVDNMMTSGSIVSDAQDMMTGLKDSFAKSFMYISSGEGKPMSEPGKYLLQEISIPFYDPVFGDEYGVSLWALSETYLQGMSRVLNNSLLDDSTYSGATDTSDFLIRAGVLISDAYGKLLELTTTTEMGSLTQRWITWLVTIYVLTFLVLLFSYITFLFAVRRTALVRVFTFHLFTLIPYDTMEKLATEAKERYHQIHLEKSFRRPKADVADVTQAVVGEVKRDVKDVTQTEGNAAGYDGTLTQIKSCMKPKEKAERSEQGSQRQAPPKRVTFNLVVDVVGGTVDKKQDDKKKDEADEDVEDVDLLLYSGMRREKDKVKIATDTQESNKDLYGTVAYIVVVLLCIIACFALLVVILENQNSYYSTVPQFRANREQITRYGLRFPIILQSMLRFVHSGSIVDFQAAQNMNGELIQGIPQFMGIDFPPSCVAKLARMHAIAQTFGNSTLDVAALAAKPLNTDLNYWSAVRLRAQMSEADLLTAMKSKYSTSSTLTDEMTTYLGLPDFKVTSYCYGVLLDTYVSLTIEYRSLFYSVVEDLLLQESDLDAIPSSYIYGLVAAAAAGTAVTLIVGLTPLQHLISKYLTFRHTATLFIAFLVVLGLSIAVWVLNGVVVDESMNYITTISALNTFTEVFLRQSNRLNAFVFTLQSNYWFQGMSMDTTTATETLANVVLERKFDAEAVSLFATISRHFFDIIHINNISCTLAMNALQNFSKVHFEQPMFVGMQTSRWDITVEADYRAYLNRYPDGTYYTDRATDMARPIGEQYTIAVNAITVERFSDLVTTSMSALESLYGVLSNRGSGQMASISKNRYTLTIVTLCLCLLPLATCLWMGGAATWALLDVLHLTEKSNHSTSEDSSRYRLMLARAKYSLLFLLVLFSTFFGVGVWITQTGHVYASELKSAAAHQSDLSVSVYYCRLLLHAFVSFLTPDMVKNHVRSMATNIAKQFNGISKKGVPVGLFLAKGLDTQMLGPTNLIEQLEVVMSYLMTNCSKYLTGFVSPLPLLEPPTYVSSLDEPIVDRILAIVTVLIQAVTRLMEFSDGGNTMLASQFSSLTESVSNVVPALAEANYIVVEAVKQMHSSNTTILFTFSFCLLFASFAFYVIVVVPTILQLFYEEEALRMLLQMIPPDVRDEVPAIMQHMETGQITNASELQHKFEANEKLLQNILPQKIATRLKSGEQPIADNHGCVTMLFTDFVGFTKRSSTMQASEIVDFLNEVFLEFDTIVELLNLEKIKTIGDAFFMAGGLDAQVADHGLRVVEAGLQFFDALEEHNRRHPSRQPLQMRLGIHSGPVVAGVIGIKKVAYDLWGDSVEIANAMESTGVPGYVHISEDTAKFVRGFFRLQPRGELPREKEHIPDNMPATYLVMGRELPTPYMHIRRPRMIPTNFRENPGAAEK